MDPFEHEARLESEITSLDRWLEDLRRYLSDALDNPEVTLEEFMEAVARMSRIYSRLKTLYDMQWERLQNELPDIR